MADKDFQFLIFIGVLLLIGYITLIIANKWWAIKELKETERRRVKNKDYDDYEKIIKEQVISNLKEAGIKRIIRETEEKKEEADKILQEAEREREKARGILQETEKEEEKTHVTLQKAEELLAKLEEILQKHKKQVNGDSENISV